MNHNVTQRIVNNAWTFVHVLRDDGDEFEVHYRHVLEELSKTCSAFDDFHNQPPVNPARRRPTTTYGQARISRHNKSDL